MDTLLAFIAQWTEQTASTGNAAGSNPAEGTTNIVESHDQDGAPMSRRRKPPRQDNPGAVVVEVGCADAHAHFGIGRAEVWPDGSVSFDQFGPESIFVDVEGVYVDPDAGELIPHTTRTFACARCSLRVPVRSDKEAALFSRLAAGGVFAIELRQLAAIV